jgi:hypothetical protein
LDSVRGYAQRVDILPVERVVFVLESEEFEGPGEQIGGGEIIKKDRLHRTKLPSF